MWSISLPKWGHLAVSVYVLLQNLILKVIVLFFLNLATKLSFWHIKKEISSFNLQQQIHVVIMLLT